MQHQDLALDRDSTLPQAMSQSIDMNKATMGSIDPDLVLDNPRLLLGRPIPYDSQSTTSMASVTRSALAMDSTSVMQPDEERVFHMFPKLPIELRCVIWTLALNEIEPRVVNIERKNLKKTVGDWEKANGAVHREDIFVTAGIFAPGDYNKYEGGQTRMYGEEKRYLRKRSNGTKRLNPNDRHNSIPLAGFKNRSTPPPLIFVSRESHIVATRFYRIVFSCLGSVPETYFNFEKDTLLLRAKTFMLEAPSQLVGPNNAILDGLRGLWGMHKSADLERVKHLALQIRLEDELDTFLGNLLEDFKGLETLSLVVGKIDPGVADWSSIHLIETIRGCDFRMASASYENSPADPLKYQNIPILCCCHNTNKWRNALDIDSIEDYILECSREGDLPGFQIPKINFKKVMSKESHELLEKMQNCGRLLVEKTLDLSTWEECGGAVEYLCQNPVPSAAPSTQNTLPAGPLPSPTFPAGNFAPLQVPAVLLPSSTLPAGSFASFPAPAGPVASPPSETETVDSKPTRDITHLPNGRPILGDIQVDHFAGLDKTRLNDEEYILDAILNDPGDDLAFEDDPDESDNVSEDESDDPICGPTRSPL